MKKYTLWTFTLIGILHCSHQVGTSCLTNSVEKDLISGKPVLQIGDQYIHEGEVDALMEIMPGFRAGWNSPEDRKKLAAQLIEQELFFQKAQKEDLLTNNKRLQKNLWLQIRNYQAGTYLLQEVDKRAKDQYEKDKNRFYTQVEIRDILYLFSKTGTEDPEQQKQIALTKAAQILKKINSKNFAQIAAEESDNPIAKANGGVIGAVSHIDERVRFMGWKPLVDEAFRLKKGKISKPILTAEGVHIIQVTSSPTVQSFEAVQSFIRTQIEAQVKNELLAQMLKETPIKYLDPTLDPAYMPAAQAPVPLKEESKK